MSKDLAPLRELLRARASRPAGRLGRHFVERLPMGADERQIREMHSTWIDAVNAGDLARLLTLVADDVVFLNPGQAPFGLAELSANQAWEGRT